MLDIKEIYKKALFLIARREHSQFELKQKLLIKGASRADIETVLASLAKEGLQCDERFAETYVRYRVDMGFGPRRISMELKKRGLSESLIRRFVPKDDEFWERALSSLWQRKYHTQEKDYEKQARFLLQRGFTAQQVYSWMKTLGQECDIIA